MYTCADTEGPKKDEGTQGGLRCRDTFDVFAARYTILGETEKIRTRDKSTPIRRYYCTLLYFSCARACTCT